MTRTRTPLAAVLFASACTALAQAPAPAPAPMNVETPKPKCESPPSFPGRVGMQMEDRRHRFERDLENWKKCLLNFVEERKAVIKANETAARAAIETFNAQVKKYQEEQEAARSQ